MTDKRKHGSHTTINHLETFDAYYCVTERVAHCGTKQRQTQLIVYSWTNILRSI